MPDYKIYGSDIQVVLVHGGPGARNSMTDLALLLSKDLGVLEINQTKYTIDELIEEMKICIRSNTQNKLVLLGHSWGAWLVCMYAAKYPADVKSLILVGSGSFDESYLSDFHQTRMNRLSNKDKTHFDQLMAVFNSDKANKDPLMKEFGQLMAKLDTYDYMDNEHASIGDGDYKMYASIWPEASAFRQHGQLLEVTKALSIPLHVVQGSYDSHQIRGIKEPFDKAGITCDYHILKKCGHYPWRETYAKDAFIDLIKHIVKC